MSYVSINTKHIITIFTIIVIVIEYTREHHDQQEKHFHFYLINDIIKGTAFVEFPLFLTDSSSYPRDTDHTDIAAERGVISLCSFIRALTGSDFYFTFLGYIKKGLIAR
ncbi:hypothetical protein [Priestia abyssalis]|uniref:hypothetical protein n=1 Tax=Priestia abyssalis TaxID=1221450 RepID=UPI00099546AD|nr:hypothetical protein [Priestia abyssalis]